MLLGLSGGHKEFQEFFLRKNFSSKYKAKSFSERCRELEQSIKNSEGNTSLALFIILFF